MTWLDSDRPAARKCMMALTFAVLLCAPVSSLSAQDLSNPPHALDANDEVQRVMRKITRDIEKQYWPRNREIDPKIDPKPESLEELIRRVQKLIDQELASLRKSMKQEEGTGSTHAPDEDVVICGPTKTPKAALREFRNFIKLF